MIWSNPKLRSNRLDNSWFVSAENVDVDLLLCQPFDKLFGSRSKVVGQTKDGDGLPVERNREDCSGFLAEFMDSRMLAEVQPSGIPTP